MNNLTTHKIVKCTISSIVLLSAAHGVTVATWDLTNTGSGAVTVNPDAVGASAGAATAGAGLSTTNFTASGFGGSETGGFLDASPTLASVITDGQYLSFTVTPGTLGITYLSFDYYIEAVPRSSNTVSLMSSVGGFVDGNEIGTYTHSTEYSTANVSFDVSSLSSESSPIEFRLYLYGKASSPNAGSSTFINNLSLAPEPTSLTLLGLGGLALFTRRNRS